MEKKKQVLSFQSNPYSILLSSTFRTQKSGLMGMFVLVFLVSVSLFSSLILYTGGRTSISAEMDRLGFGDFTVWVNGNEEALQTEISALPEIEDVTVQPLIYAGYEIGGQYSDDDGQLIVYDGSVPYGFIAIDGTPAETPEIEKGNVYISPALSSSFSVEVGDTIQFELTRQDGILSLEVAGYFADGFQGSSMIDRKSFLISAEDRQEMLSLLESANDYDVLGNAGAMLHVFAEPESALSQSELQKTVMEHTSLPLYTEFAYSKASILAYMLLLQNILTGFLAAFSVVLLVICLIVLAHHLSAVMVQNRRDMAILKTIGLTGAGIRTVYMSLYAGTQILGLFLGLPLSVFLAKSVASGMVTSTGLLIMCRFPAFSVTGILLSLVFLFVLFLWLRTEPILSVFPMQTIQDTRRGKRVSTPIFPKAIPLSIALRELWSGRRKYVGLCLISIFLTLFLSMIGRMGAWLGPNGEGLMNAFSVADHDLGVQPFNERVPMDEIERIINWYSPIREKYELAMTSVTVNGQEYTANVLNDTKWFHVLEGQVCDGDDILITDTVANEQELSIGDTVTVAAGGRAENYQVSGIYQCANGMGSNIGMSLAGYSKIGDIHGFIWCYHYTLEDGSVRDYVMTYLQEHYRGIDVHTNSWSGLDGIVAMMQGVIILIYLVAAVFIFIAVSLTASKLLQSELGNMAIYKSLGLTANHLRLSFALRFFIVVLAGSVMGLLLSETAADHMIGVVFQNFGIGSFTSHFSFVGTLLPVFAVTLLFFGFAWLLSARIRQISLVAMIAGQEE